MCVSNRIPSLPGARCRWLVCALVLSSCTDADFYYYVEPSSPLLRANMAATVCAPDDLIEPVPYKVLFVVDTSASNDRSDPTKRRVDAVNGAIQEYIGAGNVYFGVITFSDQPRRQTYGFVRDQAILDGAVANIGQAAGGTNYSDTLWIVIDFVLQDLSQLQPSEASRTHYLVFWLSDGSPTVGVLDPTSLLPGVKYLKDAVDTRAAEFHFNTAFLGGDPDTTPEAQQTAKDLLTNMAAQGDGTFTDVPGGQAFSFDINPLPVVRHFVFDTAVVNNRSARFGADHPLPDSDMDGVLDDTEATLKTNPDVADTDGDGFTDGVEVALRPTLDPGQPDDGCATGALDTDEDGLRDCEELMLGTDPNVADTDGDHFLDGIELVLGTSPLTADPAADGDLDGYTDDFELRAHLAPRLFNTATEVDEWAYRYEIVPVVAIGDSPNNCYTLTVSNLSMYQTHGSADRPRGQNTFEAVVAFVPDGATSPVRFARARTVGRFLLPDYREPADGTLTLAIGDFSFLP